MSSVETMKSWARLITSYDEVPDTFKGFYEMFAPGTGDFPYTIFAPPCRWFRRRTNAKLMCICGESLHILEKYRKEVTTVSYDFRNINYIELGTVLLHSWIIINGVSENVQVSSTIEFNSVMEYLFKPIVEQIRFSSDGLKQSYPGGEIDKFNFLASLNFKLMNYARQSIPRGERVSGIIFQPAILTPFVKLFGRTFWRKISAAHVVIVTGKELIIIKDNNMEHTNYGGVWTFIPLERITGITINASDETKVLELCIHLPYNDCIRVLYELSKKQELEMLRKEISSLCQPIRR